MRAAVSRPSGLAESALARPAIGIPIVFGLLVMIGGGLWVLV